MMELLESQSTEGKCLSPQMWMAQRNIGNETRLKFYVLEWALRPLTLNLIEKFTLLNFLSPTLKDARPLSQTLSLSDLNKLLFLTYPFFREQTYPELSIGTFCSNIRCRLTQEEAQHFINYLEFKYELAQN